MQRILVVDDEKDMVKLLENRLKAKGFEVVTAKSGIDAFTEIKKQLPHLIILDVVMPGIDGYEVCQMLKTDPLYKDIPILLFTGRDQEISPWIGKMMGIGYLQKPYKSEDLISKVNALLGKT